MTKSLAVLLSFFALVSFRLDPPGRKPAQPVIPVVQLDGPRCSFDVPDPLFLDEIDTTEFSKDGYYKVHSTVSNNAMQLFVFDSRTNPKYKVSNQLKNLNRPEVFTASKIDSLNEFGQYHGTGVIMTGEYNGGIIKGVIRVFSANGKNRGFLVVQQQLSGNIKDKDAFAKVEKSFQLK